MDIERLELERFRGRYTGREDLLRALQAEAILTRRGRQTCILETLASRDDQEHANQE